MIFKTILSKENLKFQTMTKSDINIIIKAANQRKISNEQILISFCLALTLKHQ